MNKQLQWGEPVKNKQDHNQEFKTEYKGLLCLDRKVHRMIQYVEWVSASGLQCVNACVRVTVQVWAISNQVNVNMTLFLCFWKCSLWCPCLQATEHSEKVDFDVNSCIFMFYTGFTPLYSTLYLLVGRMAILNCHRCEWECECVCACAGCPVIHWHSHLVPSFPKISFRVTMTLARIKHLLMMDE